MLKDEIHRLIEPDSLDSDKPLNTRQKLRKVREHFVRERQWEIEHVITECDAGIALLSQIKTQAKWLHEDPQKRMTWSSLGANQGNAGKHVDSHVIGAYHLDELIEAIDIILGDEGAPKGEVTKPKTAKKAKKKGAKKS